MIFAIRFSAARKSARKPAHQRDPEATIRAFLRTLQRLAPQPQGGAGVAAGVAREKP